jgi:hypothetical protein
VDFQEVANVIEHGECSGDSDSNPQDDAHFALPGDELTGAPFLLAAAVRLATPSLAWRSESSASSTHHLILK